MVLKEKRKKLPQGTPMEQRKGAKREGSSKGAQSFDNEPQWVSLFFDIMFIVEFNFNARFNRVDVRLDQFDDRMDYFEYDVHYLS